MQRARARLALVLGPCLAVLLGCSSFEGASATDPGATTWIYEPDLAVSDPPFDQVHANWKQRLDQPYVYIEHLGSYTETGRLLPVLDEALRRAGVDVSGPPFALFYDDPGRVPIDRLRSRACLPVAGPVEVEPPLEYAVLPNATVVYCVASGPYPELPRCYPGLYAYMRRMAWVEDGPIREIYLVPPSTVADWSELRAEVQIPVAPAP